MIQNSPIRHRTIYNSFSKLQKAISEQKFRVKSLRTKTVQNDLEDHVRKKLGLPSIYNQKQSKIGSPQSQKDKSRMTHKLKAISSKTIDKNYQQQLVKIGLKSSFLQKLFELKSQQSENNITKERFLIFIKNLALRICYTKNLQVMQLGYSFKTLQYFFNWFISWDGHISQVNLSNSSALLNDEKVTFIMNLLQKDEKLLSLILCNNKLNGEEISSIFDCIIKKSNLFVIDLSNQNSHNLNRFGDHISVLSEFIAKNQSVSIMKLNNIQLKREGVEAIWKGITSKKKNTLRMLSISNNHINGAKMGQLISDLLKSGLTYLDLSCNPLGEQFYKSLPYIKPTYNMAIRQLNLSETNMKSDNCYDFFSKIQECKTLAILKLDNNDFSHHWFSKLGDKLQINNSLQELSLNNCEIKSFMPIFQGLAQNKYLKRIYANYNNVNCDNELPKKIIDGLQFNKELQQLRFKFCNLNQDVLMKIIEGLNNNKKLRILDISENLMGEDGGLAILKMLEVNNRVQYLGLQKLQISQQIRRRILIKLDQNKQIREKNNLATLRNLKNQIKQKDIYTWDDLQNYQRQEQQLKQKLNIVKAKVDKLEKINQDKKKVFAQFLQNLRDRQRQIQAKMQQQIRKSNEIIFQNENYLQIKDKKIEQLKKDCQNHITTVQMLQVKIKRVNLSIKSRQNDLEQKFRNNKYLQKRHGSKSQILPNIKKSIQHNH